LTAKKQPAVDTFKKLTDTVTFFEQHKELRTYQPNGLLAVMSDFTGPNWELARRRLTCFPACAIRSA